MSACRSSEIEDDEYNEFYKSFSKDSENPLSKTHFTAEGEVTFKSILFIPNTSPVDWQNQNKNKVRDDVMLNLTFGLVDFKESAMFCLWKC